MKKLIKISDNKNWFFVFCPRKIFWISLSYLKACYECFSLIYIPIRRRTTRNGGGEREGEKGKEKEKEMNRDREWRRKKEEGEKKEGKL